MAEYYPQKIGYALIIDPKYDNELDVEGFSLMMKNPSYCYKFYWLEAIVKLISENIMEATFEQVIRRIKAIQRTADQYGTLSRAGGIFSKNFI